MAAVELTTPTRESPGYPLFDDLDGDKPIRAELFGLDRLGAHAQALGDSMKSVTVERGRPLLARFLHNARSLRLAHQTISLAYREREPLGHDADWLLDNYHIISDALAEVHTDLPQGYYRWLPKLSAGHWAGLPRVYILAMELLAHSDSSLDETHLSKFIQAFQTATPLTVGELWAIPIMLRLCLVDNLRRLAEQIVLHRRYRQQAQAWLDANLELIQQRGNDHFALDTLHPEWRDCYIVHLLEALHSHELTFPEAAERLHQTLERGGHEPASLMLHEKERQAANQVSIGNCVTSLRVLTALD
jgi:cyclic beta-1,2-glucan synthetase